MAIKVFGITMVKDEEDILRLTIQNLLDNGVDRILAYDNLSTDSTPDILNSFPNVEYFLDEEIGYYQSKKMSHLYRLAVTMGADWVIPFDADELWAVEGIGTIKEVLSCRPATVLSARICNHVPSEEDNDSFPIPRRINNKFTSEGFLCKVVIPGSKEPVSIGMGNHSVDINFIQQFPEPSQLVVHHFPWRSPWQYHKKIKNGYNAYLASDLPGCYGTHWRNRTPPSIEGSTEEFYSKFFHSKSNPLEVSKCPFSTN